MAFEIPLNLESIQAFIDGGGRSASGGGRGAAVPVLGSPEASAAMMVSRGSGGDRPAFRVFGGTSEISASILGGIAGGGGGQALLAQAKATEALSEAREQKARLDQALKAIGRLRAAVGSVQAAVSLASGVGGDPAQRLAAIKQVGSGIAITAFDVGSFATQSSSVGMQRFGVALGRFGGAAFAGLLAAEIASPFVSEKVISGIFGGTSKSQDIQTMLEIRTSVLTGNQSKLSQELIADLKSEVDADTLRDNPGLYALGENASVLGGARLVLGHDAALKAIGMRADTAVAVQKKLQQRAEEAESFVKVFTADPVLASRVLAPDLTRAIMAEKDPVRLAEKTVAMSLQYQADSELGMQGLAIRSGESAREQRKRMGEDFKEYLEAAKDNADAFSKKLQRYNRTGFVNDRYNR